ncbi:MAG: lasso peptide biosynthesis B2 protein [Candidatus Rokubacteria bacterium]|nr:lasso peptide biosynthesis B2 protein [Candidatus Rokubacteria bacterium]
MKFVIERIHRVFELAPGERVILVQAWGLFVLVEVALRILSFTRLLTLSDTLFLKRRGRADAVPVPSLPRLAWLVEVAGRYVPVNATCLKQALVLSWILGRRGIATTLRIGVARPEGILEAHAWLERQGEAIGGLTGDGYEPLGPPVMRRPETR